MNFLSTKNKELNQDDIILLIVNFHSVSHLSPAGGLSRIVSPWPIVSGQRVNVLWSKSAWWASVSISQSPPTPTARSGPPHRLQGLLLTAYPSSAEITWNDLLWKWCELGRVPRSWDANSPIQRASGRREHALLGPLQKPCVWFCFGGGCSFFFFFYSQGLDCYNSSLCSWSAGYWLAGPAVTSKEGSESEQDCLCPCCKQLIW